MTVLATKTLLVADAANKCAPGLPASFCHHHETTGCVGGNGLFCAGWAADNFDRYVGPSSGTSRSSRSPWSRGS